MFWAESGVVGLVVIPGVGIGFACCWGFYSFDSQVILGFRVLRFGLDVYAFVCGIFVFSELGFGYLLLGLWWTIES